MERYGKVKHDYIPAKDMDEGLPRTESRLPATQNLIPVTIVDIARSFGILSETALSTKSTVESLWPGGILVSHPSCSAEDDHQSCK